MFKLGICCFLILASLPVKAKLPKKSLEIPKLVAIQNKANYLDSDLSIHMGVLPSDAFNKGLTFGLSYSKFITQYKAWEIVNIQGSINLETSLKKDFLDLNVDVEDNAFGGELDPINLVITTNYVYTPFYSKSLLFNTTVINSETSFVAGIGAVKFKKYGFQPLVNVGMYSRYYTNIGKSWKFDFRWNFHKKKFGGVGNFIYLGAAYSMQLGDVPKHLLKKKRF